MREVHTALAAWMARLGMTVRVDAIGNLRGVYPPRAASLTPCRGAAPLHRLASRHRAERRCVRRSARAPFSPSHSSSCSEGNGFPLPSRCVGFSDEEGVRFGAPFLGSRALAGTFDPALLDRLDELGTLASRRDQELRSRSKPHPRCTGGGQRARVSRISYRAGARARESQPAACRGRCHIRPEPRRGDVRRSCRARRDHADDHAEGRAGVCGRMDCRGRAGSPRGIGVGRDSGKNNGRAGRQQRRARPRDRFARCASSGRSHAQGRRRSGS